MPDLDILILEWRKKAATSNASVETLDELETHLRETTERFVRSGMPVSNAFQLAVTELGTMSRISSEFRKLDPPDGRGSESGFLCDRILPCGLAAIKTRLKHGILLTAHHRSKHQ